MPIPLRCPSCKTSLPVADSDAGQKIFCPSCGQKILVPIPRNKTVLAEFDDDPAPQQQPSRPAGPGPREERRDEREEVRRDDRRDRRDDDRDDRRDDRRERRNDYPDDPRLREDDRRPRLVPGKAQAIGFMLLLGGAFAPIWAFLGVILSGCLCFAWPGTYYELVFGVVGILRGVELMGSTPKARRSPRSTIILQIICAVNLDPANITCGILGFVFLNDPEVARYYRSND